MLLLLIACLARGPALSDFASRAYAPPPAMDALLAGRSWDEVFDEAILRREQGDLEGAIQRLGWLRMQGDVREETLYQLARTLEMDRRIEEAAAAYLQLLEEHPDGDLAPSARLRLAICLDDLGHPREALRVLDRLPPRAWDRHDAFTIALVRGVALLHAGRTRAAHRVLDPVLEATARTGEVSWYRARALHALLEANLQEVAAIRFVGRDRADRRSVHRAADRMVEAEDLVRQVVETREPEWILRALLALGDAYAALADALDQAPVPEELGEEARRIYEREMQVYVDRLRHKAWATWDAGLDVASRTGWHDATVEALRARRAAAP